jgi:hypothetical protein
MPGIAPGMTHFQQFSPKTGHPGHPTQANDCLYSERHSHPDQRRLPSAHGLRARV